MTGSQYNSNLCQFMGKSLILIGNDTSVQVCDIYSKEEMNKKEDISFSPLAMPLLAGPGSMSFLITLFSNRSDNVNEALYLAMPGYIQHDLRTQNVGAHEFLGAQDAPVHVRFRREMDHCVAVPGNRLGDRTGIADIAMHE